MLKRVFFICFIINCFYTRAAAQSCPPNLDFEEGDFNNWTCYTGNVSPTTGEIILFATQPQYDRHTMYSSSADPIADYFGGFPVNCPNGSGHSIRLGDKYGGRFAEGVSYEFTIPADKDIFSFMFYYALVLQGGPGLEVEIKNMTDDQVIMCPSRRYNGTLPGCFPSQHIDGGNPVMCRDWAAATVNLNGLAGKTIRVFFKTGDDLRGFSYAYVDIGTNCSITAATTAYCPGDTVLHITAPPGYKNYAWFNPPNFNQMLQAGQTIRLQPPPAPGTTLAVLAFPHIGFACLDTFYYTLRDTLRLTARAGNDTVSCNNGAVYIGAPAEPDVVYSWSPATGLNNPGIANPLAAPDVTTTYILTVRSPGGGCLDTDTITVTASTLEHGLTILGKEAYCTAFNDSAVLQVHPATSIQWYRNNTLIPGATAPRYRAPQSGLYQALLKNEVGCTVVTPVRKILIEDPVPGIRYPDESTLRGLTIPLSARRIGDSVLWNPSFFLSADTVLHPRFTGTATQQYTITQITGAGCITVDTLLVNVYKDIRFYVPTAFTPNRDGLNDYLAPVTEGISSIRYFRIYNRWGQLVYAHKPGSPGWDGSFMGMPQPMQTVVWIAEGIGVDKKVYREKGSCVLLK